MRMAYLIIDPSFKVTLQMLIFLVAKGIMKSRNTNEQEVFELLYASSLLVYWKWNTRDYGIQAN